MLTFWKTEVRKTGRLVKAGVDLAHEEYVPAGVALISADEFVAAIGSAYGEKTADNWKKVVDDA